MRLFFSSCSCTPLVLPRRARTKSDFSALSCSPSSVPGCWWPVSVWSSSLLGTGRFCGFLCRMTGECLVREESCERVGLLSTPTISLTTWLSFFSWLLGGHSLPDSLFHRRRARRSGSSVG